MISHSLGDPLAMKLSDPQIKKKYLIEIDSFQYQWIWTLGLSSILESHPDKSCVFFTPSGPRLSNSVWSWAGFSSKAVNEFDTMKVTVCHLQGSTKRSIAFNNASCEACLLCIPYILQEGHFKGPVGDSVVAIFIRSNPLKCLVQVLDIDERFSRWLLFPAASIIPGILFLYLRVSNIIKKRMTCALYYVQILLEAERKE